MCKVYTGYCGTSEIEHGLCTCTVDNPLAKVRGLSLRTGAYTIRYLSLIVTLLDQDSSADIARDGLPGKRTEKNIYGSLGTNVTSVFKAIVCKGYFYHVQNTKPQRSFNYVFG